MPRKKRDIDFARVDRVTAKRLLDTYMPIVGALVPIYPHVPKDDLLEAGRVAILEGFLRHDHRSLERTWIRKFVHWRLAEAATPSEEDLDHEHLGTDPQLLNGADPEEQFWRATAVSAIAQLTPRQQIIVTGKMQGETYAEIAETLGISTSRTALEGKQALHRLKGILEC